MKEIRIVLICIALYMLLSVTVVCGASKKVVAQAEVVSGGDLLIVATLMNNSKTETGYDFNYMFQFVDDYVQAADYAAVNLETSMGGQEMGYCGFPRFNTPETLVTAAKNAGFDMFMTASNHSYDLGYDAVLYRQNVLDDEGVDYIGTRKSVDDSFHKVIDVNGIKIGMINYTKETWNSTKERIVLNRISNSSNGTYTDVVVDEAGAELIASYNKKYLGEFYAQLEKDIKYLKKNGAQVIVVYPHWGTEYNIGYNNVENNISQKMCDLGVDVIIGGHQHVVAPTKVYTSKKSGKTTICLHSMGNFISAMGPHQTHKKNAEYTTDGALFKYVVKKYSDGTVAVTSADVLPLYVGRDSLNRHVVIPLDKKADWTAYGIAGYSERAEGYESYQRTESLVRPEIKKFNYMPKVRKNPVAKKVKKGVMVNFKVAASGNNLKYQWQYTTNGGKSWKNATGKGNKTEKLSFKTIKKFNGRIYRCRIKNGTGTVFSTQAKLTVR